MSANQPYTPKNKVRIVTAAAIFDGHDAAINIMRRILQGSGAEVIHLGHNRSVAEVVDAAIQEDAQGICVSSYQGGHMEFFSYMRRMLDERGAGHIRIFGGGGGVIVPREIEELHEAGIDRVFSPEDGRQLGLQGMINLVMQGCDYDVAERSVDGADGYMLLARRITLAEARRRVGEVAGGGAGAQPADPATGEGARATGRHATPVIGITGPGGAGKSSLTDELLRRFLLDFPEKRAAVLSVDPSKRSTGGALLGDRIRFNSLKNPRAYLRSLATRGSGAELNAEIEGVISECKAWGFDLIFVETAGIGQGDSAITEVSDLSLYVMTAEYGAPSQLEKIEMLDCADFVAINKFGQRGSEDALRDVRKQYQRNRKRFSEKPEQMPVFGTNAAHFNDSGVNALYGNIIALVNARVLQVAPHSAAAEDERPARSPAPPERRGWESDYDATGERVTSHSQYIIPPQRERYLSEISEKCREYHAWASAQRSVANDLDSLQRAIELLGGEGNEKWEEYSHGGTGASPVTHGGEAHAAGEDGGTGAPPTEFATGEGARVTQVSVPTGIADLQHSYNSLLARLHPDCLKLLREYDAWEQNYEADQFSYQVRGKEIRVDNYRETLSGTRLRKVARPKYHGAGNRLFWRLLEGAPGEFPYTSGVYPFKREREEATRMFAGEGPSERTNARFHLLASGQPSVRLSTAFDSITLYGENPDLRPDIYGKIGESGVSIFTVEEAERLYSGFDLCHQQTSVSMTINGPAPTVLAFFMNTAVRQECRKYLKSQGRLDVSDAQCLQPDFLRGAHWKDVRALLTDEEYARIKADTLRTVRGTVQADILKEDQGQNTCIFSTEFALRAMGDVQQFFIQSNVRNFYSVSISGYHIAEAGANPIHQLAFTLANGFTYVEYYCSRGMRVDEFAPNLSFFFSNGMDAEYSVIGRVARRIWAVAMARLYGADARSQMLKYHIQTSGRSLHAMEIEFNDIRTTLQALLAIYDNAQSLHTNAFDEAITTPTEESVRRAMAIQLIINREFGLVQCENATQGSFIIEELTDLVEEAVLQEFDRITMRGGVLGAMERQYQRGAIQDDSLKYEHLKHSGELPLIGVNTFLPPPREGGSIPREIKLSRATPEEKQRCLDRLADFHARHADTAPSALEALKDAALKPAGAPGGNLFAALMDAVEHCSLGQITAALFETGGEYRRNV